jgi:hypothetical protein
MGSEPFQSTSAFVHFVRTTSTGGKGGEGGGEKVM